MHDFRIPDIPAESVLSGRFRVHAITSGGMEPALRGGRDYALLAPVATYEGEGIYLMNIGAGTDLFRVCNAYDGNGGLLLSQETAKGHYNRLSRERFDALVVGIVVADIRTRDERFLRGGT